MTSPELVPAQAHGGASLDCRSGDTGGVAHGRLRVPQPWGSCREAARPPGAALAEFRLPVAAARPAQLSPSLVAVPESQAPAP